MTCSSGKVCHPTHASAMRHAHKQMLRQRGIVLNVYRCTECSQWHVTSNRTQRTLREENYRRMRQQGEQR